AWGPLAGGLLTGKYAGVGGMREGERGRLEEGDRRLTDRNLEIANLVAEIAAELAVPPAQVALAWLRTRGDNVIPIVGARSADQLKASLGYLDLDLGEEHLRRLDEASAVSMGFPGEMLTRFGIRH